MPLHSVAIADSKGNFLELLDEGTAGKGVVGINGGAVRDHYLLEKPPQDLAHAIRGLVPVKSPFFIELGQELLCTLNGAGYKLRKKCHKSKKSEYRICRLYFSVENIDCVT